MTDQEAIWLSEYLKDFNATGAAERAGYKWPNKQGPAKKAKFADEIKAIVDERLMSADEALVRLSEMGRGDLADFNDVLKTGHLEKSDKSFLIKKIKTQRRFIVGADDAGIEEVRTEIELHDAQAAIDKILKIHGKGESDQPQKVVNYTADEWKAEQKRRRQEAAEIKDKFSDVSD